MKWEHQCTSCGDKGDQTTTQPPHIFDTKCPICKENILVEIL